MHDTSSVTKLQISAENIEMRWGERERQSVSHRGRLGVGGGQEGNWRHWVIGGG